MSRVWTWTIVAFWAITMGLLVRDKVMPGLLQQYYPTYAEGLYHLEEEETQMGIFLQGQKGEMRIGVSRTSVSPMSATHPGDAAYAIQNETTVDLSALALSIGSELTIRTTTLLDSRFRVKTHDILIRTGLGDFVMNGVVRDETTLVVQIQTPLSKEPDRRELYFDSAMALSTGLSPFHAPSNLRIGREWTVNRLDPMSAVFGSDVKSKPLMARVERMEEIEILGVKRNAFVVSLRGDRYDALAWIGEDGAILQEKVPFTAGLPMFMRREPVSAPGK
ncbi:MAG: hypothetical protein K8T20_03115 [Planctomycetes bacterium]|nr:hypothetical protein [Planctomycetota bacterium]